MFFFFLLARRLNKSKIHTGKLIGFLKKRGVEIHLHLYMYERMWNLYFI